MSSRAPKDHLSGYQARDYEVVDYRMYQLGAEGLWFRGPALGDTASGEYVTCIGAAQTFGCFCEHPFPTLVGEAVGLQAVNFGYGGAGPEFFMRHAELDEVINSGRLVIIQVMSGRSQSNSMFDARGLEYLVRRSDGATLGSDAAYERLVFGPPLLRHGPLVRVTRRLAPVFTGHKVRRLVDETRAAWIDSYRQLVSRIKVPTILFWYSTRRPAYVEDTTSVATLFGEFPQLVNEHMVTEVRKVCNHYVECVSQRGVPQRLFSRFTGAPVSVDPKKDRPDLGTGSPWTHNTYYPSPEMHQDAAAALIPVCRRILTRR